jgi:aspartate/methionine/tyrosine aminotransferase
MRLGKNAQGKTRSGVRAMMDLAWGRDDVIHLELGEPGEPTPAHIVEAAARAAARGETRYAPTPGLPALRSALGEKVRAVNRHRGADSQNILVTNGGAHALFAIFGCLLDPGSQILIPDPGWASFSMIARAVGGDPVYYPLTEGSGYMPDLDGIRQLVEADTRAIVVNSPSNPLGTVIPRPILEELYALCEELDLWIVSDECYDSIDFSGKYVSFGSLEDAPRRVLSVFSFSKVYAMTGWRVGYCHLPPELTDPALNFIESSILCVNTPAQYAALAAIEDDRGFVQRCMEDYRRNRDMVISRLAGSQFNALKPEGGFYVWMEIGSGSATSEQAALELLERHRVAVTPGNAFGPNGEGYLRLSLATRSDLLEEGLDRLLQYRGA